MAEIAGGAPWRGGLGAWPLAIAAPPPARQPTQGEKPPLRGGRAAAERRRSPGILTGPTGQGRGPGPAALNLSPEACTRVEGVSTQLALPSCLPVQKCERERERDARRTCTRTGGLDVHPERCKGRWGTRRRCRRMAAGLTTGLGACRAIPAKYPPCKALVCLAVAPLQGAECRPQGARRSGMPPTGGAAWREGVRGCRRPRCPAPANAAQAGRRLAVPRPS